MKWVEILLLYLIGLMQGIVFVTFPAAGSLLTNANYHDLSSGEYGSLFIPMIIGAILSSLGGGKIGAKIGLRPVFLTGLMANLIAMLLFAFTALILKAHTLDYIVLLIALFFLGLGFGSTITILNTYVAEFFPVRTAVAMTILHTLLGIGTAVSPLLFDVFVKVNVWWGDPLLLTGVFALLWIFSWLVVRDVKKQGNVQESTGTTLSFNFWVFVLIIFFYGYCETTFGNWATIYLHTEKQLTVTQASYALSLFWGMVTVGRILVAILSCFLRPSHIYVVLPILIVIAFAIIPGVSGPMANIIMFGFGGLACSGCFPLSFSISESDFPNIASIVSGSLMASYMFGYGVAAYGIGLVHEDAGISLNSAYLFAILPAALMALLVILLLRLRQARA